MICPICGSSNGVVKAKRRNSDDTEYFCIICNHVFDREDIKDFNENREEDDERDI